jgi:hypothetical protein
MGKKSQIRDDKSDLAKDWSNGTQVTGDILPEIRSSFRQSFRMKVPGSGGFHRWLCPRGHGS